MIEVLRVAGKMSHSKDTKDDGSLNIKSVILACPKEDIKLKKFSLSIIKGKISENSFHYHLTG